MLKSILSASGFEEGITSVSAMSIHLVVESTSEKLNVLAYLWISGHLQGIRYELGTSAQSGVGIRDGIRDNRKLKCGNKGWNNW